MIPPVSAILADRSDVREEIYRTLLTDPQRPWRIAELAAQLPQVSVEAVKTTLYLMLGDRLVEPLAGQRNLTLRLSARGHTALRQITASWTPSASRPSHEPDSAHLAGPRAPRVGRRAPRGRRASAL